MRERSKKNGIGFWLSVGLAIVSAGVFAVPADAFQAPVVKWSTPLRAYQPYLYPERSVVGADGTFAYLVNIGTGADPTYVLRSIRPDGTDKWDISIPEPRSDLFVDQAGKLHLSYLDGKTAFLRDIPDNPYDSLAMKWTDGTDPTLLGVGPEGTSYVLLHRYDQPKTYTLAAFSQQERLKWTYPLSSVTESVSFDSEGNLYLRNMYNYLALRPDGSKKWEYVPKTVGDLIRYTMVPDGTMYGQDVNRLFVLNSNGTEKWSYSYHGNPDVTHNADGTFAVSNLDGSFQLLSASGQRIGTVGRKDGNLERRVLTEREGLVYLYDEQIVEAYRESSGEWEWERMFFSKDELSRIDEATAGPDGTLYLRCNEGDAYFVMAVNGDNGLDQWEINTPISEAPSVYTYNSVIAIGNDGTVYLQAGMNVMAIEGAPVQVKIHNVTRHFAQPPVVQMGRTLLPLRELFESLGATVTWNQATATITAVKGNRTIQLQIGSRHVKVNGADVTLDVPAQLVHDHTMVPVRFASEALGMQVNWNGIDHVISLMGG